MSRRSRRWIFCDVGSWGWGVEETRNSKSEIRNKSKCQNPNEPKGRASCFGHLKFESVSSRGCGRVSDFGFSKTGGSNNRKNPVKETHCRTLEVVSEGQRRWGETPSSHVGGGWNWLDRVSPHLMKPLPKIGTVPTRRYCRWLRRGSLPWLPCIGLLLRAWWVA